MQKINLLNTLNDPQYLAATTINEHVRIIAGAGSGKTRVLMVRIAYLINEVGILPWRILAITFTNKAANEMKERLEGMIGDLAHDVKISTIHSLCVRILREDGHALGYPKSFTILDPDDQKSIIRRLMKENNLSKDEVKPSAVINYISNNKSSDVSVEKAKLMAGRYHKNEALLYEQYENTRKEMKAMDFDDLLRETDRLLKTEPEIRKKWQNRYDFIHVDEFQDVDPIQYSVVKQLCAPDTRVCVVGDPDQTIYTWRGASVDLILKFDRDYIPCQTVILNENYRSTKPILEASNQLIANNSDRIKKDLFTNQEGGEEVQYHEALEDGDEPLVVAKKIVDFHKQGIPYKEMAILYRSNYISRSFEKTFRAVGLPYRIYGGIRFYERQEVKDILSYLRLCTIVDDDDPERFALDLAIQRIINVPKRSIGAKTIEKIQQQAALEHINMYDVLSHPEGFAKSTTAKLVKFYDMIEDLKRIRETSGLLVMFDALIQKSGYQEMLEKTNENDRLDNILELRSDIEDAIKEDPNITLEQYLQDISLFTDKQQEETIGGITLMTVHAAKGLEFDVVFVASLNDGIFPSGRAIDDGGKTALEEERRLLYVAMTRAKKYLVLTWSNGYSYVLNTFKTPSRFLMELPAFEKEKGKQETKTAFKKKKEKYRNGDMVEHDQFGQGVIVSIDHDMAMIAFSHKIGVKKINLSYHGIHKA